MGVSKKKLGKMMGLGSSCGACKFLRRKCTSECVFAPYFCYEQAANHFAAVHRVFGASNVSKLLLHLPIHNRSDAAQTVAYEALARISDPIYGCVALILSLQQQVANLQEEIDVLVSQMAIINQNPASMETLSHQDQQVPLPIHPEDLTEIQSLDFQINEPLPDTPLYRPEDQNPFCEGAELGMLEGYPWLEIYREATAREA